MNLAMRTVFVCSELALQIEGFDTHAYHVDERVHVRFRSRLIALVIAAIHEAADIREISLRPLTSGEMATAPVTTRVPAAPDAPADAGAWVDEFCKAIEGAKGSVLWRNRPPSP
jgi:hypothetical protein